MVDSISGFGRMSGMSGLGTMQQKPPALTDEQKSQVESILSKYDSSSVTETDAKAIFQAFKDAGIRGAGLKEAIEEAGFDAESLRSMGMPEGANGPKGGPPPGPPPGGSAKTASTNGTTSVSNASLQTLQDILSQYNLSEMSEEDESSLLSTLTNSGLLQSGYLIDLSA